MAEIRNVCVYCGSLDGAEPDYAIAAEDLGRHFAEAGVRLVYGGGSVGLMGIVARSVLRHGGQVLGIIPQFLRDREIMLKEVTELVVTPGMHDRKRIMFESSDAFVALPGGIGTLEETVEMMTWAQLGQHVKPVVLANVQGFWDPLIDLLRHMDSQGFVHKTFLPGAAAALPYTVVDRVADVLPVLRQLVEPAAPRPGGIQPADVM
jgi:uncharacterized protein (TIGR00730 family)